MPHRLTLVQMSEEIRARKLSPVELLQAHQRQIEKLNPAVNAFVGLLWEDAFAAAALAEEAQMRGELTSTLHGIPVTIKDSFDLAGTPTTCGSRLFAGLRAGRDAAVVRRFRQAGAIPIGKTNCPEFLSNYESDNLVVGRTNNPWNLERTAGGSSGGEAAAIAARFSAGGIGSDGGGSVRVPAHFCGVAALKPTPGRISSVGHVPEMSHPTGLLGVAGPMARDARDLRVLFEALAGYDAQDAFAAPVPLREPELAGLRVGVMEQFYKVPVQAAVRKAIQDAARCLRECGFAADLYTPKGLERAPNLWWFLFGVLPSRITKALIAGREEQVHWTGTEFLQKALEEPEASAGKVVETLSARDRMRAGLLREMEDYPVLLLPPCAVAAFEHRQRRYATDQREIGQFEAMMCATTFNLVGLPAVVIPFGMDGDGMPVGIQLVGRPYTEELLLELAVRLEEARGPFGAPKGFLE